MIPQDETPGFRALPRAARRSPPRGFIRAPHRGGSDLPSLFRARLLAVLVCATAVASNQVAAEVELPRRSPRARLSQQVGLTEIAVDYFSPAVRGRQIWGSSVPYGKVWRSVENPAWRITFSRPVVMGDEAVPAGAYSLLAIPSPDHFVLIVNRNANLIDEGRDYKPDLDLVRIKVPVQPTAARERLTFLFSNFTDDEASLNLEWDKIRVSIPIRLHTRQQVVEGIKALEGTWRSYADVALYMLETKKDYEAGLLYIEKSLALQENSYNSDIKASLLEAAAATRDGRKNVRGRGDKSHRSNQRIDRGPGPEIDRSFPRSAGSPGPDRDAAFHTKGHGEGPRPLVPPAFALSDAPIELGDERPARERRRGVDLAETQRPVDIAPVIHKGAPEIQTCYQRVLRQIPALTHGKITVSVNVGVSGFATSVDLRTPAAFRVLDPCLREVVSRWEFPASPTSYRAEFPIVLQGTEP